MVALTLNEQQLGDANNDGVVDQLDTDWVNNNWLQPGDVHDSDDGIVNLEDLTLVTNNFGQGQSTQTTSQSTSIIPCYGCENGVIVSPPGNQGFNNANNAGVCGELNGITFYNDQNHQELAGCTCKEIKGTKCNNPSSTATWPCATIAGQFPDSNDIGTTISAGPDDWEITAVNPSTSQTWGQQDFPVGSPCVGQGAPTSTCDVSPNSTCAQQWFGSKASSAAGFMANKECTGRYTFNSAYHQFNSAFGAVATQYCTPQVCQGPFQNTLYGAVANSQSWAEASAAINAFASATNIAWWR